MKEISRFWAERKIIFIKEYRENHASDPVRYPDITGIKLSNQARFESGGRVPTLIILEKYANALGKHIECWFFDNNKKI